MTDYKYFKTQNGDNGPSTHRIRDSISYGGTFVVSLPIAHLRHRHGFTKSCAALLASLIYGETC